MRKTTSLALLLLLGGCAFAGAPAPATLESAPVSVNIRPLKADSDSPRVTQKIVEIHTGACETNDRMAVGGARAVPQGRSGPMPGMRMHVPVAPMPNACPVTVPATGQMFYHAVPAGTGTVHVQGPKSVPATQPQPQPQTQPQTQP